MDISIVIRTYNEGRHLGALLDRIAAQGHDRVETLVVDSGSTDDTLAIARPRGCRVLHVGRDEFTFGRSLNRGCDAARGRHLVFISGHCLPIGDDWLAGLVAPLESGRADYAYGRQLGNGGGRFSEGQLFKKYFPEASRIPQEGYFCNNANAALRRAVWERYRFNEDLTGLEDMELGQRLIADGLKIAYVAPAAVYHLHDESWSQVKNRYEREAIALQRIMPEVHIGFGDFLRYFLAGVLLDLGASLQERRFIGTAYEIVMFRFMQYLGAYRGNHAHRKLSRERQERYFYPRRALHAEDEVSIPRKALRQGPLRDGNNP
jgi:glycosyltransferase involved in cell wall biosynthesis